MVIAYKARSSMPRTRSDAQATEKDCPQSQAQGATRPARSRLVRPKRVWDSLLAFVGI